MSAHKRKSRYATPGVVPWVIPPDEQRKLNREAGMPSPDLGLVFERLKEASK